MSTQERSQVIQRPADECYGMLLGLFRQAGMAIESEAAESRVVRAHWDAGIGARFTIEGRCAPADDTQTTVTLAFDPKWTSFAKRPMSFGMPLEVDWRFRSIFAALQTGRQVDLQAAESGPYEVDASISPGDHFLVRFRKRLYGTSPFLSGFASGCLLSVLAGLMSNGVAMLLLLCLISGRGGQDLQIVGVVGFLIWIPVMVYLVRATKKSLAQARLHQPSGAGLAVGIGLYLLAGIVLVSVLFG